MVMRQLLACWPAAVLSLIVALVGCGSKYPLVPVQGTVTRGGGPWPERGGIYFIPEGASAGPQRAGLAIFESDGTYQASTFKDGDGLFPGRYTVRIECSEARPTEDSPMADSYVPAGFTPPPLEVKADGPRPVRYDVDVPVKAKAKAGG
jgi:hypothetical protein